MWSKILNIYYFILVRLSIIMFNPDFVTPQERERRRKAGTKETRYAKTISLPSEYWTLLEHITHKLNLKNASGGIKYCIKQIGIEEGLES